MGDGAVRGMEDTMVLMAQIWPEVKLSRGVVVVLAVAVVLVDRVAVVLVPVAREVVAAAVGVLIFIETVVMAGTAVVVAPVGVVVTVALEV